MGHVILNFATNDHLQELLNDQAFINRIDFLNPNRLDDQRIDLYDPNENHDPIDSEVLVLSIFSKGIKRILFPESEHEIQFLNPFPEQQKGGLSHDNDRIIFSTEIPAH